MQTKTLTKFIYGSVPTCTYSAQPSFATATNYQDLWWVPTESGWGVNITHQGTLPAKIFATWYTYDIDGSLMWLSALAIQGADSAYSGPVIRNSGPTWNNFNASDVSKQPVGTATFSFPDGSHMNFSASIQLSGMAAPTQITKQLTRFLFAAPAGTLCQ